MLAEPWKRPLSARPLPLPRRFDLDHVSPEQGKLISTIGTCEDLREVNNRDASQWACHALSLAWVPCSQSVRCVQGYLPLLQSHRPSTCASAASV
jgi:hypothetical protein